jgi:hypothetical protein
MNMEFELLMMALNGLFFVMGVLSVVAGSSLSIFGALGVINYWNGSVRMICIHWGLLGLGLLAIFLGLYFIQ